MPIIFNVTHFTDFFKEFYDPDIFNTHIRELMKQNLNEFLEIKKRNGEIKEDKIYFSNKDEVDSAIEVLVYDKHYDDYEISRSYSTDSNYLKDFNVYFKDNDIIFERRHSCGELHLEYSLKSLPEIKEKEARRWKVITDRDEKSKREKEAEDLQNFMGRHDLAYSKPNFKNIKELLFLRGYKMISDISIEKAVEQFPSSTSGDLLLSLIYSYDKDFKT